MWRSGANLAEKTPRWCGGAMIWKEAHVAVAQTKKSGACPALVKYERSDVQKDILQ